MTLRFHFYFSKFPIFENCSFDSETIKISKPYFSLSEHDYFSDILFQNRRLKASRKKRINVPPWNTNSMLATLKSQVISEQKIGSEKFHRCTKKQNQKSGFATFRVLISHLRFLRFPKNIKGKTHSKKTSFTVFLVRNLKRIMPVLADIQRVRAFIICKRYFVP